MPPIKSCSGNSRYAHCSRMIQIVGLDVAPGNIDRLLQIYAEYFRAVDDALADDEDHGRTTTLLLGELGEPFSVYFLHRYHGSDRAAYYAAFDAAFVGVHGGDLVGAHGRIVEMENELMELVEDAHTFHLTAVDVAAIEPRTDNC